MVVLTGSCHVVGHSRHLPRWPQINPPLDRCVLSEHIPVTFVPMRVIEVEGGGIKNPETRLYGRVKKGYTENVHALSVMVT